MAEPFGVECGAELAGQLTSQDERSFQHLLKTSSGPVNAVATDTAVCSDQTIPCTQNELTEPAVPLNVVRKALSCQLCQNLVAASLVMHCSHVFCGTCLFEHLNQKPQCPTCQVGMRAIPVRCLALDHVSAAFTFATGGEQAKADFDARTEEGKAAANKINKMFWWLQSTTPAPFGDNGGMNVPQPGLPGALRHSIGGCAGAPALNPILNQQNWLHALGTQPQPLQRAPGLPPNPNPYPMHTQHHQPLDQPSHNRRCSDPSMQHRTLTGSGGGANYNRRSTGGGQGHMPRYQSHGSGVPPHGMLPPGMDQLLQHAQYGAGCPPAPYNNGGGGQDYSGVSGGQFQDPVNVLQMLQQMSMGGAWAPQPH